MFDLKKLGCTFAIGALTFVGAATAKAQQQNYPDRSYSDRQQDQDNVSASRMEQMNDTEFARRAAEMSRAQERLAALAEQNGQSDAIQQLGQRTVEQQRRLNDRLSDLATRDNINLPDRDRLNDRDQDTYDRLSQVSGPQFDRECARALLRNERMELRAFRYESQNGQDDAIREFASRNIPILEQQLRMSRETLRSVGGDRDHDYDRDNPGGTR